MFGALEISTSGLIAQRTRMDTIANNIAAADVTRARTDASGQPIPYRRQYAEFEAVLDKTGRSVGVRVARIADDPTPFRKGEYNPTHPDAAADGHVYHPNVDLATEYVNAMEATRAYEANISAMEATKSMLSATLRLLA